VSASWPSRKDKSTLESFVSLGRASAGIDILDAATEVP
jgi:hypothetical protein